MRNVSSKPVTWNTITGIRPGTSHANRGRAFIKRVDLDADGNEVVSIDVVPITTERLEDVIRTLTAERAPRPPVVTRFVKPDSEEGQAMGLVKPTICDIPDYSDEKYLAALEEYNQLQAWSVAAEALDVPLYYAPGEGKEPIEAKTTEEKIRALRQAGWGSAQIREVAEAVARISNFTEEERRSFFGAA